MMEGLSGSSLACIRSERVVFQNLAFSVAPGDALVLTGPNGSGKSSLLRVMAGLLPPAAGTLAWNGRPVADDPEAYFAELHYLGHRDAVKPALTVRENVAFWCALRGGGDPGAALRRLGLSALADLPARLLSAGQTRRLALARILAIPARLWLLDEPTVGLDATSVAALLDAIADHRGDGGAVVLSTNVAIDIPAAGGLDVSGHAPADAVLWAAA